MCPTDTLATRLPLPKMRGEGRARGRERGREDGTYEANSHGDLTRLKKGGTKEDERGGRERDVHDKMDRTWERQKKGEREVT